MFRKVFMTFMVVMLIIFQTTSCNGWWNSNLNRRNVPSEDNNLKSGSKINSKEIKTITMFSEDEMPSENNFSSPVAKAITDATGVRLDIKYPVGDVSAKTGIMIASGDYPDLIMVKNTAQFVDAGAYIDLAPLIKEYATNLQKLYGKYLKRLRYSDDNPAIYVLPTSPVNNTYYEPNMGFELQHAVVKELGYPKLKTVHDFEAAIKAYIEKHPKIDGQPTIGISLVTDDWRWNITLGNPAGFATGLPDDGQWYIHPETYEAQYRFLRPEEKEYFRWLNHMYVIGLLDPDCFVQKFEAYEAKIASGRVLGLIDTKWEYRDAENSLIAAGKEERTYGQYPIQLDSTTLASDFRDTGYLGGYGIGISINCENPVETIKFLDFMAGDEGHILRYWGIKGVNYMVDEKGHRFIPKKEMDRRINDANYFRDTGVGVYTYPFPAWGNGVVDSTGSTYTVDSIDRITKSYSSIEKEVLKAYGCTTWSDLYPKEDQVAKSDWGAGWMIPIPKETGISETLAKCDEIVKKGLINAIVSSPEKFDANWELMMKSLKNAGVYEMNQKFTELVKKRVTAWK